jgi:hypothetical protein
MKVKKLLAPTPRTFVIGAAVVALVVGGAAYAAAGHDGDHRRAQSVSSERALIAGTATGAPCRTSYDTETSSNTPPDESTTDNVPAASVQFKKPCAGAVIASFDTEVNGSGASDFLHADVRGTCVGTGGTASPCTVGSVVFASPGHTFLQTGATTVGTRSAQWVFANLPRGIWKFEVLPGGNGAAFLGFRTLIVSAYAGG